MCANSLEKAMMLRMISRTRRTGKQRTHWFDNIKSDANLNIQQLKSCA